MESPKQDEELKFEDSSDIITSRLSIKDKQACLRRRMVSKKAFSNNELYKRIEITELKTPSIDQRSRQAMIENRVSSILFKESLSRTDSDYELLDKYFTELESFQALKNEYDSKIASQFLKIMTCISYKPDEEIIKYCIFLIFI